MDTVSLYLLMNNCENYNVSTNDSELLAEIRLEIDKIQKWAEK